MKKNIFSGINIFHSKGKLRKLKVINHINKYKLECCLVRGAFSRTQIKFKRLNTDRIA